MSSSLGAPQLVHERYFHCTLETCAITTSFYSYRIDLAPNAVFLAIFALALLVYTGIYISTKRGLGFFICMLFTLFCEILGYVGRILSRNDQWNENWFLIQIICLTIGPVFLSAGLYLCLSRIVDVYGEKNSRIPASWYMKIFIPCDVLSLLLQAVGGALAAIALNGGKDLQTGTNIMVAGLSTQVFTMFVYVLLCIDFARRLWQRGKNLGDKAFAQGPVVRAVRVSRVFRWFLVALAVATVTVFCRCAYRVAELSKGWKGPLTHHQSLFVVFEGLMIVLAVISLAAFHPSIALGEAMKGGVNGSMDEEPDMREWGSENDA